MPRPYRRAGSPCGTCGFPLSKMRDPEDGHAWLECRTCGGAPRVGDRYGYARPTLR